MKGGGVRAPLFPPNCSYNMSDSKQTCFTLDTEVDFIHSEPKDPSSFVNRGNNNRRIPMMEEKKRLAGEPHGAKVSIKLA